jgi:hypothetical protein
MKIKSRHVWTEEWMMKSFLLQYAKGVTVHAVLALSCQLPRHPFCTNFTAVLHTTGGTQRNLGNIFLNT